MLLQVYGRGSDHLMDQAYDEIEEEEEEEISPDLFMQYDDGEPFYSNILVFDSDNDEELGWNNEDGDIDRDSNI